MNTLLQYYQTFMEISKSNPIVGGLLGVWGAGLVTFALRKVPGQLYDFLYGQLTTSLVFNNTEGNERNFTAFMDWFTQQRWAKWSRSLSLDYSWSRAEGRSLVGMGYGRHFFIYKNRLFWVRKKRLESSGTYTEKQEFAITGLTRNQSILRALVETFRWKPDHSKISVFQFEGKNWVVATSVPVRDLSTVILNSATKTKMLADLEYFVKNEEWFRKRGLPYKATYIFHGPPGTGKTSLVKAISSHFHRDVYPINLAEMSDRTLGKAVAEVPRGSAILFEDFDTNAITQSRAPKSKTELPSAEAPKMWNRADVERAINDSAPAPIASDGVLQSVGDMMKDDFRGLTLSGLLNVLDGIVQLDDVMVFMTTNHLENIDAALLRKGRVDQIYEIPLLTDAEVREYVQLMYPGEALNTEAVYLPIAGCDLQALFLEHKEDYVAFEAAIPRCLSLKQLGQATMGFLQEVAAA